ncbi:MAG: urea ABC transporter permease subunit UrtC [Oscillospiraceae bacterium]|jgi:urea transport system permease protein|nr:urea ABC transporter permease subunit UrtC [Oscillospiraceae bacterium]
MLKTKRQPAGKRLAPMILFLILAVLPGFTSDFQTNLLGKFLCYAIIAVGLDLIWGYTGILSLGHGVFFGLGAYSMAIYMTLSSTGGAMPSFMKWSGLSTLPAVWRPFANPVFAIVMAVLIPMLLALLIGFLTFRNRIKGVFFSIISQALAVIIPLLIESQQAYTGGTNGLTNFRTLFGLNLYSHAGRLTLYYVTFAVLALSFLFCTFLVRRRTGSILVAIRDGENRMRFTGYNPTTYKLFVYCLSAGLAGLAGALYVPQSGIISPTEMGITPSVEMVIWVAVGGKVTLFGAVLGAVLVSVFKFVVSSNVPDAWSYIIGAVFVLVILFLPKGLMGIPEKLKSCFARRKGSPASVVSK